MPRLSRLLLASALAVAPLPALAAGVLKGDYVVCKTRDDLDEAVRVAVKGDEKSMAALLSGSACRATKAGEKVKVLSRSATHVKLRPAGTKATWWTVTEAMGK